MKILDIAFKDMLRSFRSAFAIGMMLIAPLMLTGLIYFAFGSGSNGTSDLPAINLGILNLDTLPADAPLETSLGDNIHDLFFDESVSSMKASHHGSPPVITKMNQLCVRLLMNKRSA